LLAIAIGIVIQLIPLPAQVIAGLSPSAVEVRRALQFSAFGSPTAGWIPLTIDPEAQMTVAVR
jgi:hypothetical protein